MRLEIPHLSFDTMKYENKPPLEIPLWWIEFSSTQNASDTAVIMALSMNISGREATSFFVRLFAAIIS